jgi:putative transposase
MSVKIHAAVNAEGKPVQVVFTPGQQHDITVAEELVVGNPESVAADKAYDSDDLIQFLDDKGIEAVIPPKSNRKVQREYDKGKYRRRHKVENYFCYIKAFRRIATRYDHTITSYSGFVFLASIIFWT